MHGKSRLKALRERITYANVTASLALFVALGGTSYAVTALPRNSVGRAQLRDRAVSTKKLAPRSVTSRAVRDQSLSVADLSTVARKSLRGAAGPAGPQGPSGVTLRASMTATGQLSGGNASNGGEAPGDGAYTVTFAASTAGCTAVAAPTDRAGSATAASDGGSAIVVRTYNPAGSPADTAFSVIVAC